MFLSLPALSAPGYDPSPFGMNGLNLIHGREDPNVFANGVETAKVMKDAGMYWARLELWWGVVEPDQGKFDWTFSDKVAQLYRQQKMNGLVLLCYSSAWSGKPPADDAERARYANYVYQVVNRYKNTFKVWEIWNEPNIPTFWPEPNVEHYTLMLKEAYRAAKRADPSCFVLAASTSGPDLNFIKGIHRYGGWDYCDGISIHPYSMSGGPIAQRLDKILRMHQEFIASSVGGGVQLPHQRRRKPLWITEMGWTTHGPESERDQAVYLFQSYVIALANGVEKLFWFCLEDWSEKWGVIRSVSPLSAKPSYETYKLMTRHFGAPGESARFEGYLRMPAGVACYAFKRPDGGRFLVLWSNDRNSRTVRFPRRTPSWQAVDIFGRPVDFRGDALQVGPTPIIITGMGSESVGPVSPKFNPYLDWPGRNLLNNGSMEIISGGRIDWWNEGRFEGSAGDGIFATVDGGRRGSKCVSIGKSGERAAYDNGPIPVDAGKTYRLTGWIKTENATGNNQLGLFWYGGDMWSYQSEVRSENITGTHDWTKVILTAKAPFDATFVRVNLISENNTGAAFFDDVSLTE
jgi:hypothetical protein